MPNPQKIIEQLEKTASAWKTHALNKNFITSDESSLKPKFSVRATPTRGLARLTAALNERDNFDRENLELERKIA